MAKLTKDDLDTVISMLKQEKTYQSIADTFGVSRERIRQIARSHNLHGLGKKARAEKRRQMELTAQYDRWGQFADCPDKKFAAVCKAKYRVKKHQVIAKSPHEWDIEFKDIIWNTRCPILDIELDYFSTTACDNSPSFDRIDNTKGYVKGNVIIISWRANRLKNNGTKEDFEKILKYLS